MPRPLLFYFAFLPLSYWLLLRIISYTSYHEYFWKLVPLLLGYSAAVGYLLYAMRLEAHFLAYVVVSALLLFLRSRKEARSGAQVLDAATDLEQHRFLARSLASTRSFFAYSAFLYVAGVIVSFLYVYNR